MVTESDARAASPGILIVDDDELISELVVRALTTLGISRVSCVRSGEDALGKLEALHPDIIICDLNMPGMDGVEILRHLALRRFPGGIIILSGAQGRVLKTVEDLAREHNLYILGAVAKPITAHELGRLIRQWVPQTAAAPPDRVRWSPSETDLAEAVENREFVLNYQPKVHIAGRRLAGVEALIRWDHPVHGRIGPDAFIPLAESADLIDAITEWVIETAFDQLACWRDDGLQTRMALNVSIATLERLDLPELISEQATRYNLNLGNVTLEVTESGLMRDVAATLETLSRLSLKGVELSIDDFGTGYSTMEQLRRLPFAELKIDRNFVKRALEDREAMAIFESSVDLAKKLGMRVVAEGVETQPQWDMVERLGCDLVQGYLVGKPMPGDVLGPWATTWSP